MWIVECVCFMCACWSEWTLNGSWVDLQRWFTWKSDSTWLRECPILCKFFLHFNFIVTVIVYVKGASCPPQRSLARSVLLPSLTTVFYTSWTNRLTLWCRAQRRWIFQNPPFHELVSLFTSENACWVFFCLFLASIPSIGCKWWKFL